MGRYYIKKNKLQLAVTTLINTDWDNPHTYMDITAEQFAKSFKNSDMTPYQLSLTFGTKHWQKSEDIGQRQISMSIKVCCKV